MPGVEIERAQSEIDKILYETISGTIKDEEIQKIKNRIEAKSTYRRQLILSKADLLAHYKTFYNDAELINTNLENYLNVTKDDIVDSSLRYITPNNRVVLHYLPLQDENNGKGANSLVH